MDDSELEDELEDMSEKVASACMLSYYLALPVVIPTDTVI